MKNRPQRFLRLLLTFVVLGAGSFLLFAGAHPAERGVPGDLSMHLLPPAKDSCDAYCTTETCDNPRRTEHEYLLAGPEEGWLDEGLGSGHGCEANSCTVGENPHTECNPSEEEEEALDTVLLAVETLDGSDLQRFVDRNSDRIRWNAERGALQVLGCGHGVLASIQLRETGLR